MKTIYLIPVFLFINSLYFALSQNEEVILTKGGQTIICGRIVVFDHIWFLGNTIKADISILMTEMSKPITGGYNERSKIEIKDSCYLYLNEIDTNGLNEKGGIIKLSRDDYIKIIRKIPLQRKMNEPPYDEKISLLKVYLYSNIDIARPVIEYYVDGKKTYLVFDVVRTFDSEEEALTYAKKNNITDVILK